VARLKLSKAENIIINTLFLILQILSIKEKQASCWQASQADRNKTKTYNTANKPLYDKPAFILMVFQCLLPMHAIALKRS
jgi:hypothetical protein